MILDSEIKSSLSLNKHWYAPSSDGWGLTIVITVAVSLVSSTLLGGDDIKRRLLTSHVIDVVDGMTGSSEHTSWTELVEEVKVINSLDGWVICISVTWKTC